MEGVPGKKKALINKRKEEKQGGRRSGGTGTESET
jgi:hypothetical protein